MSKNKAKPSRLKNQKTLAASLKSSGTSDLEGQLKRMESKLNQTEMVYF